MSYSLKDSYKLFNSEHPEIKISFSKYKNIVQEGLDIIVEDGLFKGKKFYLGSLLGFIQILRIERDFSKPKVNWPATNKVEKVDGKPKYLIYHTEPYRIKWYWCKSKAKVRNKIPYRLDPLRGKKGLTQKLLSLCKADDLAYLDFELRKNYKK